MKRHHPWLLLLAFALPSAVYALDGPAERARMKSERAAAESLFVQEEVACRGKFAVNDCVAEARVRRNAKLTDLRRQEVTLNDEERRAKAAQRQTEIDERTSPERRAEAEQRRAEAVRDQKARQAAAADKQAQRLAEAEERGRKAATRPRPAASGSGPEPQAAAMPGSFVAPAGRPSKAASAAANPTTSARTVDGLKAPHVTPTQAAANRQAYELRLKEAADRKARLAKQKAERKKPAASDLPMPP